MYTLFFNLMSLLSYRIIIITITIIWIFYLILYSIN